MQLLGLTFELCTIALTEISQRPGPSMHILPLELDPHLFVGIESLSRTRPHLRSAFL